MSIRDELGALLAEVNGDDPSIAKIRTGLTSMSAKLTSVTSKVTDFSSKPLWANVVKQTVFLLVAIAVLLLHLNNERGDLYWRLGTIVYGLVVVMKLVITYAVLQRALRFDPKMHQERLVTLAVVVATMSFFNSLLATMRTFVHDKYKMKDLLKIDELTKRQLYALLSFVQMGIAGVALYRHRTHKDVETPMFDILNLLQTTK